MTQNNAKHRDEKKTQNLVQHSNSASHANKISTVLISNSGSNNNTSNMGNIIQTVKSNKGLIRPKDLPGYKS